MTAIPDYNYPSVKVERHLRIVQVKAKSIKKKHKKKLTQTQKEWIAQQIIDKTVANQLRYIRHEK